MTSEELRNIIKCGETSLVQFKQEFTTQKEMATEMIAFANGRGGTILFGVEDKTGDILGLSYDEIQSTSRELGNTANEQFGVDARTIRRALNVLQTKRLIRHDGPDKGGRWIILAYSTQGVGKV